MERGLLTRILSPRILMPISAERNEELDRINVHLLGRPYVELNGKRMNFPYKKAEGFFYYLCVKKNATREEIIYVLWGSDNENVGRNFLDISILWKNIVSAVIMGIAMYFIYGYMAPLMPMFLAMVISAAIGGVIYVIIMVMLKGLDRHDGQRMPIIGRFFK